MHKTWSRRGMKGQSLVETSLTLPLFLLLIFGIFEFGRALWQWHSLYRVAQDGARQASIAQKNQVETAGKQAANSALTPYPFKAATTILVTIPTDFATQPVTVRASAPFQFFACELLNINTPNCSIDLNATASAFQASLSPASDADLPDPPPPPAPESSEGTSSGSGTGDSDGSDSGSSSSGDGSSSSSGEGTETTETGTGAGEGGGGGEGSSSDSGSTSEGSSEGSDSGSSSSSSSGGATASTPVVDEY